MSQTAAATAFAPAAEPADDELLARHRAGDPRALDALVRRHQRPVYRLALRFARDADEADDLAQRTFLRAFAHVDRLESDGAFRAYLFRTAANLCKNHLRDRARLIFGVPLDLPAPEQLPAEERQRRQRVRESLARLPLRQRQVVSLRIDAGLAFAEVAEALGITENNAKVTYHNAVKRLRGLLEQEEL